MMQIRLSYLAIVISCFGCVGQADAVAPIIAKLVAKKVAKKAAGFAFRQALTKAGQTMVEVGAKAGQTVVEAGQTAVNVGAGLATGAYGQIIPALKLANPINWLSGAKDVVGHLSKLNLLKDKENLLKVTDAVKKLLEATKAMTSAQMAEAVGGKMILGAGVVAGGHTVLNLPETMRNLPETMLNTANAMQMVADAIQKKVGDIYAKATASEKPQLQELKDKSDALSAQTVVCSQEAQKQLAAQIAQATPSTLQKLKDNASSVLSQVAQREQVLLGQNPAQG